MATETVRYEELRLRFTDGGRPQERFIRSDRDCGNDPARWHVRYNHAVRLAEQYGGTCETRTVEIRTITSDWEAGTERSGNAAFANFVRAVAIQPGDDGEVVCS